MVSIESDFSFESNYSALEVQEKTKKYAGKICHFLSNGSGLHMLIVVE
jgi:hypothetical protein